MIHAASRPDWLNLAPVHVTGTASISAFTWFFVSVSTHKLLI